jgi:hypothetical protein
MTNLHFSPRCGAMDWSWREKGLNAEGAEKKEGSWWLVVGSWVIE